MPIQKIQYVCWFLVKNLCNFVPLIWKLDNPYCHTPIPPKSFRQRPRFCIIFPSIRLSIVALQLRHYRIIEGPCKSCSITFFSTQRITSGHDFLCEPLKYLACFKVNKQKILWFDNVCSQIWFYHKNRSQLHPNTGLPKYLPNILAILKMLSYVKFVCWF